jgi:hypothetical protein
MLAGPAARISSNPQKPTGKNAATAAFSKAFPSEAARSTLPGGRAPKMGNPGVIEVKANERTR